MLAWKLYAKEVIQVYYWPEFFEETVSAHAAYKTPVNLLMK